MNLNVKNFDEELGYRGKVEAARSRMTFKEWLEVAVREKLGKGETGKAPVKVWDVMEDPTGLKEDSMARDLKAPVKGDKRTEFDPAMIEAMPEVPRRGVAREADGSAAGTVLKSKESRTVTGIRQQEEVAGEKIKAALNRIDQLKSPAHDAASCKVYGCLQCKADGVKDKGRGLA